MASGRDDSKTRQAKGPAILEWIAGAVGAVIAIAMLSLMAGEQATSRPDLPPLMHVEPVALKAVPGQFVLEIKVVNRSHQTAAAVAIEGELEGDGEAVETSSATLTYVPGNSEAEAGLVFTADPRRHRLRLRVTGYEKP